jgi:hypothetical protein
MIALPAVTLDVKASAVLVALTVLMLRCWTGG